MGTFTVNVGIGRLGSGELTPVEAMVDTGSIHSVFPASLLGKMNVTPSEQARYSLADGSVVEYGFGMVNVAIDEREYPCPCIFGPDDQYLLGATTLETFMLKVDPVEERLVPKKLFGRMRFTSE